MNDLLLQPYLYWQSGGLLMIPLALVCIALWSFYFRVRAEIASMLSLPDGYAVALEQAVEHGPLAEIDGRTAFLPDTLRQAVGVAVEAYADRRPPAEAFDRYAQAYLSYVRRDVAVLTALTTAAPLLGLLGTVIGMIATFQAVSDLVGDTSAAVAQGISQALITTQFGLAIAIPGLWGAARLRRLLRRIGVVFARCRVHLTLALEQGRRMS